MKLSKEDKNVLVYSVFFLITLFLFVLTLQINKRGKSIFESPKLLPFIVEGFMTIISVAGLVKSLVQGGRPTFSKIGESSKAAFADNRNTIISIAISGIYIVGVFLIGFYVSSFILVAAITCIYVRRIRFYWSILISAAITGCLYLIFAVAFKIQLY